MHSDTSYLSELTAQSRVRVLFFLSNNNTFPPNNGTIHNTAQIIKAVISSAAKVEVGALYINAKLVAPVHQMLHELGHPQPLMPIQTDNSTTYGVLTNKIIPKAMKAMDMHFHWLYNQEQQKQFQFYWQGGKINYTKHHATAHHKPMHTLFFNQRPKINGQQQQGGAWRHHRGATMDKQAENITSVKILTSCKVCWNPQNP